MQCACTEEEGERYDCNLVCGCGLALNKEIKGFTFLLLPAAIYCDYTWFVCIVKECPKVLEQYHRKKRERLATTDAKYETGLSTENAQ